jgi:hypothetical protein
VNNTFPLKETNFFTGNNYCLFVSSDINCEKKLVHHLHQIHSLRILRFRCTSLLYLQWMDKIMETAVKDTRFFITTELGSPFACNRACILLWIVSYKFWMVSIGILYRSSSSSCLRDEGWRDYTSHPTVENWQQCFDDIKSGDCTGCGSSWSAFSRSSNQDWTLLAVCMGELLTLIIASLFGINFRIVGCTWWPKMST